MAITDVSAMGHLVPSQILQEARDAFQQDAAVLPLISVADISGKPGVAAEFPIHVALSVTGSLSETTDVTTNQAFAPTFATLTVARKAVRVDIGDLVSVSQAGEDLNSLAGRLIGKARLKSEETAILGCMTTNYTSSVGATNSTAITPENVLSALLTLRKNEADSSLVLSIHPSQEYHLLDDIVVTSSGASDQSSQGQSAMSDGSLNRKKLFGFTVVSSPRVGTGTDTNDIYLGMAFSGPELGYAVKNVGAPIEVQRDASAALQEVICNYWSSQGRIRAAAFVLVKSQTY